MTHLRGRLHITGHDFYRIERDPEGVLTLQALDAVAG